MESDDPILEAIEALVTDLEHALNTAEGLAAARRLTYIRRSLEPLTTHLRTSLNNIDGCLTYLEKEVADGSRTFPE